MGFRARRNIELGKGARTEREGAYVALRSPGSPISPFALCPSWKPVHMITGWSIAGGIALTVIVGKFYS